MPDDLATRIQKAVDILRKAKVLVGIPGDARQTPVAGKTAPPLWVIGYQNEFGDDQLHIPPRPFLVPGIESVRDQITAQLYKGAQGAFSGDMSAPEKAMHAVGLVAQAAVKEQITDVLKPPLAASTLYKRKHRKPPKSSPPVDRESPLIDQGDLLRSINYAVKVR